MSLVRNEQTKLTASWLNAISAASIAVGGFAQLAPVVSGASAATSAATVALFGLVWIILGVAIHWAARRVLRGLQE
jgi:VIT1/CCC1 family predicted Fe2+/Mn2+ transporter